MKNKKCKHCKSDYIPVNTLQKACSVSCALALVKSDAEKKERRYIARRKRELNDTVRFWTKKAQAAFNEYVRTRDSGKPCISCGKHEHEIMHSTRGGKWDCGHYRSVGSCPELRFEPLNAHGQCKQCNSFKSGNHVEYRKGLEVRIGIEALAFVEGNHAIKRYRVPDLKEICAYFKGLTKELKARDYG